MNDPRDCACDRCAPNCKCAPRRPRTASVAAVRRACSLGVLGTLRAEYATITQRVDLGEEPLDDVAHALAIAPNNAKVRLHRARKALRAALLAYCGTDSSRACASGAC